MLRFRVAAPAVLEVRISLQLSLVSFSLGLLDYIRATASVLTSGKKNKQIISPSKVNFAVRGGQLGI